MGADRGGRRARPHRGQQLQLVLLPQALRVIIPPMTNQYLNLTKNSSLAVAIGYPDLVSISNTTLNQTGRAVECITIIMAVYLTLSLSTAALMNWYNARVGDQGTMSAAQTGLASRRLPHVRHRWRPTASGSAPAQLVRRCEQHARHADHRRRIDLLRAAVHRMGGLNAVRRARRRRLPRTRRSRRVLGRDRREVPADPVRALSLRRAMAAAGGDAADGCDAGGKLHATALEPVAGRSRGRRVSPCSSS